SRDVMRLIVAGGVRFVGLGLAVGLVLAAGTARLIRLFVFGVSTHDPVTYAAVALLFGAVAVAACYFPVRRVTRIAPLVAPRAD
ncbi:MAG: ABC transporter permease, partial [Gemmatimonadaceae bacterium]